MENESLKNPVHGHWAPQYLYTEAISIPVLDMVRQIKVFIENLITIIIIFIRCFDRKQQLSSTR